jgi:phosphopantetheinyl transferase
MRSLNTQTHRRNCLVNPLERIPPAKDRPESLGGKSGSRERRFEPAFGERAGPSWTPEAAAGSRTVIGSTLCNSTYHCPQLGVDPRHLEFDTTTVGKPFLTRPAQNLQFNLSHSGRHGLIAVAEDRSVGVDIEVRRPVSDLLGVVLQIATPHEAKLLKQLSTSPVHSNFLDLWTRKEAVLKALGRGFLIDPREVEVGIGPGRSYVNFDERIWTVESLAINSSVAAAAAIEGKLDTPLVVSSAE